MTIQCHSIFLHKVSLRLMFNYNACSYTSFAFPIITKAMLEDYFLSVTQTFSLAGWQLTHVLYFLV